MRLRRLASAAILALALAGALVTAMRYASRPLIRTDPLAPADAIVVLGSYRLERTLEAGTLFREGWAKRILLMRSPDISSSNVLSRVHVKVPVWLDIQKDALHQMAVPASAILQSPTQDTTISESRYVAHFVRLQKYKRIIVVTSPYHTARAGRFFRKAAGNSFEVIMRADRYEPADPDHWWRHSGDRSDVVTEYMKSIYAISPWK